MTKNDASSTFGAKATRSLILRKAGVIALAGTLALSSAPVTAIAAETGQSTSSASTSAGGPTASGAAATSDQPGEPPSGSSGDQASGAPSQPGGSGGASGSGGAPEGSAAPGDASGAPGGAGGADTMSFDYSGTYTGALEADGESVTSSDATTTATETDQNAALAHNGGALAITGGTLTKSGDETNGDAANFYGVNSVALAVGEGSTMTLDGTSLSATSEGSNAIFSTDGATVYASDVTINTTAGNSRGLDATYGGTIVAANVTASTSGDHSATVATDRGGGNISVSGASLSTSGSGSPLLYSTGDVEVTGVTGTATGSQIAGMEGLNTILVNDSTLESTITDKTASDPVANGVIIYQSTSGDAEATTGETATFQAANSTLKSAIQSGSMFYFTNTSADVVLSGTTLDFDSSAADLILAAGNDANNWGSAGSNGATVKFTGIGQTLEGTVEADTISSVDLHLTQGSTWTGATKISQNSAGSTSDSPITVNVDGTSTWVVTADSTVSNLNVASGAKVVDEQGNTVTIVANGQTVVSGTSDVTVTVTGSYSTDYDASGAGTLSDDLIDRSGFDAQMGMSTSWSMGGTTTQASSTGSGATSTSGPTSISAAKAEAGTESGSSNPLVAFVSWVKSLLGL